MHSRGDVAERVTNALVEIGPSVFQGGVTSLLGVVLCLAGGCKSIVMFGVLTIMVVIFGLWYGLVVLPLLLMAWGNNLTQKSPMVSWNALGFFAVPVLFAMKCAWCFEQ